MTDVMPTGQQSAQVAAPSTTPAIRSAAATGATTPAGITPDVVTSASGLSGTSRAAKPDVAAAAASDVSPPHVSSQTPPAPRAGGRAETSTLAHLLAADDTLPYETVENAMADIFDYLAYRPDQE